MSVSCTFHVFNGLRMRHIIRSNHASRNLFFNEKIASQFTYHVSMIHPHIHVRILKYNMHCNHTRDWLFNRKILLHICMLVMNYLCCCIFRNLMQIRAHFRHHNPKYFCRLATPSNNCTIIRVYHHN